jgi:hypothetical protein
VTSTRGDLAWVLTGVISLAVIGVKVGHLLDLDLRWTYAVTAAVYVTIVSAWASRRRRRGPAARGSDGDPPG